MSPRAESTAVPAKRDHRQEVTDSIVKMLEEGVAPWQKPWESAGTVRCHLADGAVLLGALRLPNTAFRANAGTDVTTDILFLQKRSAGKQQDAERWAELAPIDTPDGTFQINEYFVRHPEMMLGRMGLESDHAWRVCPCAMRRRVERLAGDRNDIRRRLRRDVRNPLH